LTPDGGFQENNQFNSKFEDVKLLCKLSIPNHDDFKFMHQDQSTIMKNMKGFEALIEKHNEDSIISSVQIMGRWGMIKMVHPLFVMCHSFSSNVQFITSKIQQKKIKKRPYRG